MRDRRQSWLIGAAVAAVVLAVYVGAWLQSGLFDMSDFVTAAVLYTVTVVSGLLVWGRRGSVRMGALIVAWGITAVANDMWSFFPGSRLLVTVLPLLMGLSAAVYAHMVLAYPSGRLRDRVDRVAVWVFYVGSLLPSTIIMASFDARACGPDCRPSVLSYVFVDGFPRQPPLDLANGLMILLGGVFMALVARRVLAAPVGARRSLWPLGVAAAFAVVEFMAEQVMEITEQWGWFPTLDRLSQLAALTVPVALAAGILLGERRRRGVADLVVDLSTTRPGGVRDALAQAVGDPSLELLLWEPSRERWITPAGTPAELPADRSRTVTYIGDRLAAVVHDVDLVDQRRLVSTAGSAARLALENERLQAELRAQVEELRASRARIVAVADEERRRLERDLHDGAQQRLLGVGLALQLLRPRIGDPVEAEPLLSEAEVELRAALEELRELARGIHPAVLTEQGLGPALQALAGRSPVSVSVDLPGAEGLPGEVESAVYFVAAEALTNVAKHAEASHAWLSVARDNGAVTLVVRDDGRGGADSAGSGLVGLGDRVGAMGGRLTVESGRGKGTRLEAKIPCESA